MISHNFSEYEKQTIIDAEHCHSAFDKQRISNKIEHAL